MWRTATLVLVLAVTGCAQFGGSTETETAGANGGERATEGNGGGASGAPATSVPATPGAEDFAGVYEVPIVSPELAPAASYRVAEITWRVVGDTATLEYDLPLGLVGTDKMRVEFIGPIDRSTQTARLTGPVGTAECTLSATEVSCLETMRGLLPLDIDMDVVRQVAASDYAGPAEHRVAVSERFSTDPIGIARVRLNEPVAHTSGRDKGRDSD